jgi:hypothetical protein
MKKAFLILGLLLCSCTDEDGSRKALSAAGFSQITFEGYSFTGCGQDDTYKTEFTAKNPNGVTVSGVVCCGILKGCTI